MKQSLLKILTSVVLLLSLSGFVFGEELTSDLDTEVKFNSVTSLTNMSLEEVIYDPQLSPISNHLFSEISEGNKAQSCGLGQTCPNGTKCCRLGGSVSCCSSNQRCNSGICE